MNLSAVTDAEHQALQREWGHISHIIYSRIIMTVPCRLQSLSAPMVDTQVVDFC